MRHLVATPVEWSTGPVGHHFLLQQSPGRMRKDMFHGPGILFSGQIGKDTRSDFPCHQNPCRFHITLPTTDHPVSSSLSIYLKPATWSISGTRSICSEKSIRFGGDCWAEIPVPFDPSSLQAPVEIRPFEPGLSRSDDPCQKIPVKNLDGLLGHEKGIVFRFPGNIVPVGPGSKREVAVPAPETVNSTLGKAETWHKSKHEIE
jgi:hypothetical protein